MKCFIAPLVAIMAVAPGTPLCAADLTAADGKELARQYCSACHRVTAEQAPTPPVKVDTDSGSEEYQAPSFRRIATRAERSADELREKIQAPHYPMREQQFLPEDLDAIIAYILSLGTPDGVETDWPPP